MRIVELKNKHLDPEKKGSCTNCGTIYWYEAKDVEYHNNEKAVQCPNNKCKNYMYI
jgi:uncharacterized protein with PIN domain